MLQPCCDAHAAVVRRGRGCVGRLSRKRAYGQSEGSYALDMSYASEQRRIGGEMLRNNITLGAA